MYLLIPMSVGLVLLILGVFGWAVQRGQFEDLDDEAERILLNDGESAVAAPTDATALDVDQDPQTHSPKESLQPHNARS